MVSRAPGLSIVLVSSALLLHLAACGDDASPGSGGGGGAGGQAVDGTGGEGQGGAGGGAAAIACGDLSCSAGEACVETVIEPACTPLDDGSACADGTTETYCGGAGLRCCCEPPPEPERACLDAPACDGSAPTCSCFDPCEGDDLCTDAGTAGRVVCEPPPRP